MLPKQKVLVIPSDQVETHLKANETFTPAVDGVFMSDARYQRYRRAVADKILELQSAPAQ
ncbi:MAG: hypothetical protein ACK4UN_19580 [Limisphaerales bacterium]